MSLKIESILHKLWIAAALGSALSLAGCVTDPAPAPVDEDEDTSPIDSSDDEDDDEADEEEDDESAEAPRDAGTRPRTDAGSSARPDATVDARAPSTPSDADVDEPTESSDAGSDADVEPGDSGEEPREDLGMGDGSDVITIGDSWMNYFGGGIERGLLAASGQPYRTYAVLGTRLLNGAIPGQYASAKRANPDIKTVVMTGGGNDVLLTGASPPEQIVLIGERLDELWTEMGKDGVKDVVYIEYSEGGTAANAANVRLGIEAVGPICKNHKAVRCHFMLSDPIIMKQLRDGIHPTDDGCTKLGKAAFDLMVAEGMRR